MDTQHAYSLRQLYSRRQTKPGSGQGVTESRSLEGLGSHREDSRDTGWRLFQGLHIPRAGSRSLGQDMQMSENKSTILHIPSIPTPDYHQESQNQPNPPLIPPNLNFEREEYSHARNIWGNADRYKGTISDKKGDQSAEMYREIISAMQSTEQVPPPFHRSRMLGYGADVASRVKHTR